MKRFVGGLREALESPMSLVHNPALLTGRPKAAEGTEGAIVLAGETAWRSGTLAGMGTPRAACAAAPYSILALHGLVTEAADALAPSASHLLFTFFD